MPRRTKIVATLGPATDDPGVLRRLLEAGVEVVRLGLAHGEVDGHLERIRLVRKLAGELSRPVAVLADLPGPKIRTSELPADGLVLAEGDELILCGSEEPSRPGRLCVDYPDLHRDLRPGDPVLIGDGAVVLEVTDVLMGEVRARVTHGGRLQGRPGVHLPTERVRLRAPTDEDLQLAEVMAGEQVEFVAVSFVRSPDDVAEVRRHLGGGDGPAIVAKIETRAAVDHLSDVIEVADAVMVARGDLGADFPLEDVPHLQKRIIRTCVAFGRPVITATQMLESMVHSPTPTRAEVSDVANAVFDGTDAVMLSAETAIGHDPVLAVRTMARIALRAEQEADYGAWGGRLGRLQSTAELPQAAAITAAMTHAAWRAAAEIGAPTIICCTNTGLTARAMARFRPLARIVGASPNPRVARQLLLVWGVKPLVLQDYRTTDDIVRHSVQRAVEVGFVQPGDVAVVLAGTPRHPEPATDSLRLVRVEGRGSGGPGGVRT